MLLDGEEVMEVIEVITTESGSVYEIRDGHIRRVSTENMRKDGEWIKLYSCTDPYIGESMQFILEPLGEGDFTVRTTTPVVSCEIEYVK